jgi:hypothetical protein
LNVAAWKEVVAGVCEGEVIVWLANIATFWVTLM